MAQEKPFINVSEARRRLPELVDRAADGEEIVIARGNEPLVRMIPIGRGSHRVSGRLRAWIDGTDEAAVADALLAPMDPQDVAAAEGEGSDAHGISSHGDTGP